MPGILVAGIPRPGPGGALTQDPAAPGGVLRLCMGQDGLVFKGPAGPDIARSLAGVRRIFNDLADHATGSTVAWRHPQDPDVLALELLVLREVMHHDGFDSVFATA